MEFDFDLLTNIIIVDVKKFQHVMIFFQFLLIPHKDHNKPWDKIYNPE